LLLLCSCVKNRKKTEKQQDCEQFHVLNLKMCNKTNG
jgi:hypothetical protein